MSARSLFAVFLVVALAGCENALATSGQKTGFIEVRTYSNGSGGFALAPVGAFYGQSNLVFNPPVAGLCAVAPYSPVPPGGASGLRTLDAGPRLLTLLPGREDTLHVVEQFGLRLYRTLLVAGIPVTPGDTLAVTIPGSIEFPGLTIRTRTAELFTFVDPGAPVVGEPVNLTWRSPGAPGSAMVFFLRYANSLAPGGVPNEQIVCGFADDGAGTIDPSYLNGWQTAPLTSRSIAATRVRYNEIQVDSRTRVTIVSTFEIPTPSILP